MFNTVAKQDYYPIQRMDGGIEPLGKVTVFSTLDANSGYDQIESDDADNNRTAFKFHHGLYCFVRMSLALCNATGTFQRARTWSSWNLKWKVALVYLDDIVTFSKVPQQHTDHVRRVILLLNRAGASIKLKKFKFFMDSINYLDQVIYPRRLDFASHTTDAIRGIQPPTKLTEPCLCLGLDNIFEWFIPNFAQITA